MAGKSKILIVEDTLSMALMYEKILKREGIKAELCQNGRTALEMCKTGEFSTVLLDLQLPEMSGLEILQEMRNSSHDVTFIVITANGSVNAAVDAMRLGAYDFLIKPFTEERMVTSVKNGLERSKLKRDVDKFSKTSRGELAGFIGQSEPMQTVYAMITSLANSKAPVFITGESGTGKEVTARALHDSGSRAKKPFIAINCAAIPENLMESEIFGHIKGAFTGANEARKGAASMANGGTLFLDEICEMEISLQAKLLRFLQTGQIKRVGSDWQEDVDVRIVCATNRDPMVEVSEKRFREDLLYRLNVLTVDLPPLRARGEDIVLLAETFLQKFAKEEGKNFDQISEQAKLSLMGHDWPGNVRELQNSMRKVAVLFDGPVLEDEMVKLQKRVVPQSGEFALVQAVEPEVISLTAKNLTIDLDRPFAVIEREIIEEAIELCGGSIPKAADMLSLSPSTIYRKKEGWVETNESEIPGAVAV